MSTSSAATIAVVTDATFEAEVLFSPVPVVVDFWAPWCGPCIQMAPALEQVARDLGGTVKFVKVDVDASPATAAAFSVMAVPTLVVIRDGVAIHSFNGAKPAAAIAREILGVL